MQITASHVVLRNDVSTDVIATEATFHKAVFVTCKLNKQCTVTGDAFIAPCDNDYAVSYSSMIELRFAFYEINTQKLGKSCNTVNFFIPPCSRQ